MAPLAVGSNSTYWLTDSSTVTLALILSETVPVDASKRSVIADTG